MNRRQLAIALILSLLLYTSTSGADTSLTFTNNGNQAVNILSYDWDDGVRSVVRNNTKLNPGATGSISCRKSWFDANGPGCWIYIQNFSGGDMLYDTTKLCEGGPYTLHGTWGRDNTDHNYGYGTFEVWDPTPAPTC
jgi:hypothetical protein